MTAWEIKWCKCFGQCRELLELTNLREDTKEYVESVHLAINAYPLKYPSDKQAYWIHTLHRQHCRKASQQGPLELQKPRW